MWKFWKTWLGGCAALALVVSILPTASAQSLVLRIGNGRGVSPGYGSYYGRDNYSPYGLGNPYAQQPYRSQSYYRGSYDGYHDRGYSGDPYSGYGNDPYGGYGGYGDPYSQNRHPIPYRHAENAALRIVRVLPDVSGPDDGREEVTLYNATPGPIDLGGWWLQDRHVNRFFLRGVIQPGRTATIRTDGSMPLNNGGDTVMIVDPAGRVVDSVTYVGRQVRVDRPIDF